STGVIPLTFPSRNPIGWIHPICIAGGNPIVLKAATFTPQTCMRIAELYKEAGLPDGVINIVTCSRHEAEIFLSHPDVKGITFVRSEEHTSELQSRFDIVCRLLLEKKKKH